MTLVKKETTIFCVFEELVVWRREHHTEMTIIGEATGKKVRIHFSCRRAEEEPKIHHLEPMFKYLVLCRNVELVDWTTGDFYLASVTQNWQNHFIQFFEPTWCKYDNYKTLKAITAASVFPPGVKSLKKKNVFPLVHDDFYIISDLIAEGITLPDYDF